MRFAPPLDVRSWRVGWSGAVRFVAWLSLGAVTGVLVRAEARRPELPRGVVGHSDLVYREDGGRRVRLDVYLPDSGPPPGGRPAIVAIHGGGWRGGSKDDYGRSLLAFTRHGYAVVAVDYQLSRPGRPSWPENFEDVREAVRWVRRHAREYGIDPGRIAALGASAGGHLAALLGTTPDEPAGPRREGRSGSSSAISARVQAVVDFYGPTDLAALQAGRSPASKPVVMLLGGTPGALAGRAEAASPARHVSADDPPMLLIHGGDDALVPLAQSESMASALAAAGVPHRLIVLPGSRHGFGLEVGSRDLLPEILAFLERAWNGALGARARPSRPAGRLPAPAPRVGRSGGNAICPDSSPEMLAFSGSTWND